MDAELRGHGEYGSECQFHYNGELAYGRRWTMREQALAEAEGKRQELERGGWQRVEGVKWSESAFEKLGRHSDSVYRPPA